MSTPPMDQPPAQPGPPFSPPAMAPQQPQPSTPKQPRRFGWLVLAAAAFVALLLGVGIGATSNGGQQTATPAAVSVSPGPTVTVTVTTPPDSSGTDDSGTAGDSSDSSTFSPKKSDFEISIKITDKQCFGSAGCNITFKPKLAYGLDQSELPAEGVTSVTDEVSGTEDDFTGTLELSGDGTYTGGDDQDVSTTSSSKKLVAKITEVSYNQYG